jgi:lipopolysaccharide/colanic/teichoic acid biosynthesis glycosyltransferase
MNSVDIIMPVYNSEDFLDDSISSVINQTFKFWRLIIIDDCSSDKSVDIIKKYAKKEKRIIPIFLKKNGGAAVARNEGLKYVSARYLCFLDSDDVWMKKKLEIQIEFMKNTGAPISYTSYWVYDKELKYQYSLIKVEDKKIDYKTYLGNTIIGMSTSMIDLNKVGGIEFYNIRTRQDTYLWISLLKRGNYALGIIEPLVKYRYRAESISGNKLKAAKMVWFLYRELEKFNILKSFAYFIKYMINAVLKRYGLKGYAPYKRLIDVLGALTMLLILFLPGILISIFILLDDGKPIFFIQQRVGKGWHKFRILKFRTMTVADDASKGTFDAGDRSRVTKIGRLLRKTKLDELPQLLNVLKGDMSLVGPRPEVEKWTKVYSDRWDKVLSIRPGITDNASIEFRNEEEILAESEDPEDTYRNFILPIKLKLYEKYVDNHSLKGDVNILINTIKVMF